MQTPNIFKWDIFLAHNSTDKKTVERLAKKLRDERKLNTWLDIWNLRPGQSWLRGMEEGIRNSSASAVLIGKEGIGPWENEEMQALLHLAVKSNLPIIPIFLPGAPKDIETYTKFPIFLVSRESVDLRSGLRKQGIDKIVWGATGTCDSIVSKKASKTVCSLEDVLSICQKQVQLEIAGTIGGKFSPSLYIDRIADEKIKQFIYKQPNLAQDVTFQAMMEIHHKIESLQKEIMEIHHKIESLQKEIIEMQASLTRKLKLKEKLSDDEKEKQELVARKSKLKEKLSDDEKEMQVAINQTIHLRDHLTLFSKLIISSSPDLLEVRTLLQKIMSHDRCTDAIYENMVLVKKTLRSSLLIKDVAGRGKTNTACALATDYGCKLPAILISAGTIKTNDRFALREYINKTLEQSDESKLLGSDPLDFVVKSVKSFAKNLLVIVDAINENSDTKIFKLSIQELISRTVNYPVKFIFTCRDIYWNGFLRSENDFWSDCLYDEIGLDEFSDDEFEKVLPKYFEYFKIHATFSSKAKRQLKHPLLLRFFCEAHKPKAGLRKIGQVTDIRLKPLFDTYWRKKIMGIQTAIDHRDMREVENFVLLLARKIRFTRDRNLKLSDITSISGIQDLNSRDSLYIHLLNERIVIEQTPNESEQWKEQRVTFVYDEFMEYAIARELVTKTMIGTDESLVKIKLDRLSKEARRFQSLFGVVAFLLPMLEDDFTFDFWDQVYKWGNDWHGVLCKALLRASSQNISLNAVNIATKLAKKGSITTKQDMLLLAKEFAIKRPEYAIRLYKLLYHAREQELYSAALSGLIELCEQGFINAVKVLVAALRHEEDRVRASAIYALADLGLLDKHRIRGLSRDKSSYVREAAIYSGKRILFSNAEKEKILERLSNARRDPVRAVRRAAEESYKSLKLNKNNS